MINSIFENGHEYIEFGHMKRFYNPKMVVGQFELVVYNNQGIHPSETFFKSM